MVGDNKILTVSYGTFSCTLEGFDDPFSTMKNIAEYFRDLAAGDRFFGAEPPQPDPEMLQSIAEQTIKARVNAQISDNGLVLRQDEASGAAPSVMPPMAAVAATAVAPQVAPVAAPAHGVETVAEKLQRIRAVVSRETAQDALFSEDQHVDEFAAETTAPLGTFEDVRSDIDDSAPVDTPMVEPEKVVEDAVAEVEDSPADPSEVEPDVPAADSADIDADFDDEDTATNDIDLSSIVGDQPVDDAPSEDVVSQEDVTEDVVSEELVSEDVTSEETVSEDAVDDTSADTVSDDVAPETDEETDAAAREEAAEDAIDSVLGKVSEDNDTEDATPRRRIVVQKITREDLKAAREEAAQKAASKDDALGVADVTSDSELPPEQEEDLLRELAALQTDGEDAAAEMTLETDADTRDEEEKASALAGIIASSKTDDATAEDDLADALSDLVADDEEGYKKVEQDAAREVRRARRDAITEDDEDDVERLISTTSSRLDHDESSQRRASIAHLKAAVAATKADSSLTEAAVEQEARERDQYAEDLARVVRPERKTPSGDRAKTDRPAPLVLVSELRIDKDDEDAATTDTPEKDEGPVRPRRVSRSDDVDETEAGEDQNIFSDPDQASFAEYAASANALELPDLLEAAAAYYTFVESTEQFTRPMLMRKIASISARDGFSREAGLRSFGTLLREGKLVKGTDGKFVIAKNSRFTPEARYAGE